MNQLAGQDADHDAVVAGLGVYLDVLVAAGGVQPLDGRTHVGHAQRLLLPERQDLVQFGRIERLLGRHELDRDDLPALEFPGLCISARRRCSQ
jgi:hypothetical protein